MRNTLASNKGRENILRTVEERSHTSCIRKNDTSDTPLHVCMHTQMHASSQI